MRRSASRDKPRLRGNCRSESRWYRRSGRRRASTACGARPSGARPAAGKPVFHKHRASWSDERINIGRVGGQAGQVEGQPAGKRAAVGLRCGAQAVFLELGQHETIDRIADPRPILTFGSSARAGAMTTSAVDRRLRVDPLLQHVFLLLAQSLGGRGGGITSLGSAALILAISSLASMSPGVMAPALMAASR